MSAHPLPPLSLRPRVSLTQINELVTRQFGPCRVPGNAQPAVLYRQIAMYLAHEVGGFSFPRIGQFYNGRHYTTAIHAHQKVSKLRERDATFAGIIQGLEDALLGRSEPGPRPMPSHQALRELEDLVLSEEALDALADRLADRIAARLARSTSTETSTT